MVSIPVLDSAVKVASQEQVHSAEVQEASPEEHHPAEVQAPAFKVDH
jgi:hypothetical protein